MNLPTIGALVIGLILLLLAYKDSDKDAQGALAYIVVILYFMVVPYSVNCLAGGGCTVYAWFFTLFFIPLIAGIVHLSAPTENTRRF